MDIVRPQNITDSILTSTNIPATSLLEWNAGTPYSINDEVKIESLHNEYRCLIANTGQDPSLNPVDGGGSPYWLDLGSTNRWAMFDGKSRKTSSNPDSIAVSLTFNTLVNSIAILNFSGASLNVTAVSASSGEVYNVDFDILELVDDYYEWFFLDIERKENIVALDLPAYRDLTITVSLLNTGSIASIGELIVGLKKDIGVTQYGTSPNIIDFSRKDIDQFGNAFILERGFAKRVDYDVWMPSGKTDSVQRTLSEFRATPVVWVGSEDFESIIVYGFMRRFDQILQNASITTLTLEVEELT